MKNDLLKFISEKQLISKQDKILLAVSGGIDSMVMLHLFIQAEIPVGIAHCNFQLRGEDSNGDEKFVLDFARKHKLEIHTIRFNTKEYAHGNSLSTQMAARELRYNWFEQIRNEYGYTYIATAHHSDDVVETFLLNLLRKTGISGLHGIRAKSGFIIRPMLFASKKEIVEYAQKQNIAYREDITNADDHYKRNYIRHHIVSDFQQLESNFNTVLLKSIDIISKQETLYKEYVLNSINSIVKENSEGFFIEIEHLKKLSYPDIHLFELLYPLGFNEVQIQDLLTCLDSTEEKMFCSPLFELIKTRTTIEWCSVQSKEYETIIINNIDEFAKSGISITICENYSDFVFENNPFIAYLDMEKLSFPMEIRHWRAGDYFYPFGGKGKKKLSDFFSDLKLNSFEKQNIKLLCNANGDIVWIIGLRSDNRYKVIKSTQNILICCLDF
jgi:tRNA(Ile)-lysidine synthase